eukprot:454415-Alexandrium_andersonii.AAC.1
MERRPLLNFSQCAAWMCAWFNLWISETGCTGRSAPCARAEPPGGPVLLSFQRGALPGGRGLPPALAP